MNTGLKLAAIRAVCSDVVISPTDKLVLISMVCGAEYSSADGEGWVFSKPILDWCRSVAFRQQTIANALSRLIDGGYIARLTPANSRQHRYEIAMTEVRHAD